MSSSFDDLNSQSFLNFTEATPEDYISGGHSKHVDSAAEMMDRLSVNDHYNGVGYDDNDEFDMAPDTPVLQKELPPHACK
jgi:hypothetical protein